MKIKEKLEALRDYFEMSRQVGHTSLLKQGVNSYEGPKFVMAWKKQQHTYFDCKPEEIVSWNGLNKNTFVGHKRPLVVDNGVMWVMLNEALEYIEELEEDRKKLAECKRILKF